MPHVLPFKRVREEFLDFRNTPASTGIYGIHPYPAMFHFLVVRELIKKFSNEGDTILDPFMGSGVTAGECLIGGRNFIGYDLNPLAVLISKVRTTPLNREDLFEGLGAIKAAYKDAKPEEVEFHNIDYWFDEGVRKKLSMLRSVIFEMKERDLQDFFKVAFTESVRRVSKTDHNEFKLLRKIDKKSMDVLATFHQVSLKNIKLLVNFYRKHPTRSADLVTEERDITEGIPLDDGAIDLIVTSPPYGDSRTTVAYGQFSRLSLRWLGLEERVDKTSLGSRPQPITKSLPSKMLYEVLEEVRSHDEKRAMDVFSFYNDLYRSVEILSRKVKDDGFVCFVVGNRRVKGIELPTDKISADFFEYNGFEHVKTLVRAISNKRMPTENSPSNIKGKRGSTMRYEYAVVLKK